MLPLLLRLQCGTCGHTGSLSPAGTQRRSLQPAHTHHPAALLLNLVWPCTELCWMMTLVTFNVKCGVIGERCGVWRGVVWDVMWCGVAWDVECEMWSVALCHLHCLTLSDLWLSLSVQSSRVRCQLDSGQRPRTTTPSCSVHCCSAAPRQRKLFIQNRIHGHMM